MDLENQPKTGANEKVIMPPLGGILVDIKEEEPNERSRNSLEEEIKWHHANQHWKDLQIAQLSENLEDSRKRVKRLQREKRKTHRQKLNRAFSVRKMKCIKKRNKFNRLSRIHLRVRRTSQFYRSKIEGLARQKQLEHDRYSSDLFRKEVNALDLEVENQHQRRIIEQLEHLMEEMSEGHDKKCGLLYQEIKELKNELQQKTAFIHHELYRREIKQEEKQEQELSQDLPISPKSPMIFEP